MSMKRFFVCGLVLIMAMGCSLAVQAKSLDEACGNAAESLTKFEAGKWLPWTDDNIAQERLDVGFLAEQQKLLTALAEPFMRLKVWKPGRIELWVKNNTWVSPWPPPC